MKYLAESITGLHDDALQAMNRSRQVAVHQVYKPSVTGGYHDTITSSSAIEFVCPVEVLSSR